MRSEVLECNSNAHARALLPTPHCRGARGLHLCSPAFTLIYSYSPHAVLFTTLPSSSLPLSVSPLLLPHGSRRLEWALAGALPSSGSRCELHGLRGQRGGFIQGHMTVLLFEGEPPVDFPELDESDNSQGAVSLGCRLPFWMSACHRLSRLLPHLPAGPQLPPPSPVLPPNPEWSQPRLIGPGTCDSAAAL